MKIASSTWSFHPWLKSGRISVQELIEKGKSLGLDGFEVVDIDLPDTSEQAMKEIGRYMDSTGMEISAMSLEHDLNQYSQKDRDADIDKVLRWMDYACMLDVKTVRVFTGWQKPFMTYRQQVEYCKEGLKKIVRRAEENNIILALENHNDVCKWGDELVDLRAEINSPNLRFCIDIFNFMYSDALKECRVTETGYEQAKLMLPYIQNAHLKLTAFKPDGEDVNMDVSRIMRLFSEYGYDGWWAIEFMWPSRDSYVDLFAEISKGATLIRKHAKA